MEFCLSSQDQAFQQEVATFLDRHVTPAIVADLDRGLGPGPVTRELYRQLGEKGWLTVTWERKYGGLEGTNTQRLIVANELGYHRAYYTQTATGMAGPCIHLFGTEELKEEFLPRISRNEIEFALGYTEPQAGSDLAALDIRAVDDGDDFLITGQKIFNTTTHFSDYHWLGARTDPDAPKHKGVSLIIADLKTPGITVGPLWTMNARRTNVVYYDNVRIPKRYMVGQRGKGFYHIATALDFERMFPTGEILRDLHDLVAGVKEINTYSGPLAKDSLVRQKIGELAIEIEATTLLAFHIAWLLDKGTIPNYQSSMLKLYLMETRQHLYSYTAQILGPLGELRPKSKFSKLGGRTVYNFLDGFIGTIVGGTSEVQRNIIATRGLGLPKA